MSSSYRAIVLGLGAMGSAAVYQLSKRGVTVLGIDQFEPPHSFGSSTGETRITRQAIGEGAHYSPLAIRSYTIFREVEQQVDEELLRVTGGLMVSSPARAGYTHMPDFFETTLAAAKIHGVKHDILTASDIRSRFPQFAVEDDELGYYEYESGFLRPEKCIRAQIELAKTNGAEIHFNERVVEIGETSQHAVVKTENGTYECDQLIVSAGAWMPKLVENEYKKVFRITRQVLFWFDVQDDYEMFTAPGFPIWIWENQRAESMYGFPAVDGPNGGIKLASSAYMKDTDPDAVNRDVSHEEIAMFQKEQVAPFFPMIGRECVKTAVCLYTRTPNSEFVIDRLKPDSRIIVCSPCSGHGFKHSAAIGEAVTEMALDGVSTTCDISMITFENMLSQVFN